MENKTKLEAALDELLIGKSTEEIVGPNGLLKELTKALVERAMNAELSHHLGYEKHAAEGRGSGNNRNGKSRKKVQGDFGSVEIEVPRDRNGTYDPKIVPKHERRFAGFDQKILSMYARGMTTRDIQGHLEGLRRGGEPDADQRGDRRGFGRGAKLAKPAAGAHLPDRVPGRLDGENAP